MELLLSTLAEGILNFLVENLLQHPKLAILHEKLRGDSPEKLAFQRALTKTYQAFSLNNPGLSASFFDESFLQKSDVISELAKTLTPNQSPNIEILESLWSAQFSDKPDIDLSAPLSQFITLLQDNIKLEPLLAPFVNSRAYNQLYTIAERNKDQIMIQTEMRNLLRDIRDLLARTPESQEINELQAVDVSVIDEIDNIISFRKTWFHENESDIDSPQKSLFNTNKEKGTFPLIDIKLMNPSQTPIFVKKLVLGVDRIGIQYHDAKFLSYAVSFEYNILLDPDKENYTEELLVSQLIKPNDVDRFVVVIGQKPSAYKHISNATYRVSIFLHYNQQSSISLGRHYVNIRRPPLLFEPQGAGKVRRIDD